MSHEKAISMAYRENTAENSYSVALTSDLFEGHVFTMNNMVVHKEPIIAD